MSKFEQKGLKAAMAAWCPGSSLLEDDVKDFEEAFQAYLDATCSVIVPKEPTEDMLKAGQIPTRKITLGNGTFAIGLGLGCDERDLYKKMIAASQETNRSIK